MENKVINLPLIDVKFCYLPDDTDDNPIEDQRRVEIEPAFPPVAHRAKYISFL